MNESNLIAVWSVAIVCKAISIILFLSFSINLAFSKSKPAPALNLCASTIDGLFFEDLVGDNDVSIEDGGVYFTTDIPGLLRLTAITTGQSESMKFSISGAINIFHTENFPPYTYPGGSPTALDLVPGEYIVNMMLFPEDQLGGEMCDQLTLSFTILERCFIEEAYIQAAGTDPIYLPENGGNFCASEFPNPVQLGVEMAGTHESVQIEVRRNDAIVTAIQDIDEPYLTEPINLIAGSYTLTIMGYDSDIPKDAACNERTYAFEVQDCSDCPTAPFEGGEIQATSCVDDYYLIESTAAPFYEGLPLEVIWLMAESGDCTNAAFELFGVDLGGAYDTFVSLGGFGVANPAIAGTSWSFVNDSDFDDLRLVIEDLAAPTCFMRFARVLSCETFYGNAGPISLDPGACFDCQDAIDDGVISATDCTETDEIIINNSTAPDVDGFAYESIWLRSITDNCELADQELSGIDLGAVYDAFLALGGFASTDPSIPGTSWVFVRDNNADDLQFTVTGLATGACFKRFTRVVGCSNFSAGTNSVFADGAACVDCNFLFDGGAIEAGECNETGTFIIANTQSPFAGDLELESIWLMSPTGSCDVASGELAGVNVGQLYDVFLFAGGFGVADPSIPGTSWQFVTDLDGDDLTLIVNQMEGAACFTRCTRLQGCQRLMGESNFVSVSCVSDLNDPVVYKICDHELSVEGMTEESAYFVKVYNDGFSNVIFECNSFQDELVELEAISLPDGSYVLDILLMAGEENEEFRLTKKIKIPEECFDPLVDDFTEQRREEATIEQGIPSSETLIAFPNPAGAIIQFQSDLLSAGGDLQIFNRLGQLVYQQGLDRENEAPRVAVELDALPTGMYFAAIVQNGRQLATVRFVVDKSIMK